MLFYRIAVVTKNTDIADFFRLELNLLYIGVDVFDSEENLDGTYPFVIVDTDTCSMPTDTQYTVVPLSEENSTVISANNCQLGWPLLLTDVQRLIGAMLSEGELPSIQIASREGTLLISLSAEKKEAELDGRVIKLTGHEYAILCELCRHSGRTVKRERIMELLGAEQGNISDVYVCRLRQKLEAGTDRRLIFTERGKGYYTTLHRK